MAEDGEYVQNGDIMEWQWSGEGPTTPKNTGGWIVPEGEFDPTSAPEPEVSPAERPQENPSPGLVLAEEAAPESEVVEEEVDLESLTKTELVEMAEQAGVDASGTKAELVERLAD